MSYNSDQQNHHQKSNYQSNPNSYSLLNRLNPSSASTSIALGKRRASSTPLDGTLNHNQSFSHSTPYSQQGTSWRNDSNAANPIPSNSNSIPGGSNSMSTSTNAPSTWGRGETYSGGRGGGGRGRGRGNARGGGAATARRGISK